MGDGLIVRRGLFVGSGQFLEEKKFITATGGTTQEYNIGNKRYKSHTFTSNQDFVVTEIGNSDRNLLEYFIVAGGGGGGGSRNITAAYVGGSGGGGGVRSSVVGEFSGGLTTPLSEVSANTTTYSVVVGAGGIGNISGAPQNGFNSSVFGETAIGGGAGGEINSRNGKTGGTGGSDFKDQYASSARPGRDGTTGHGFGSGATTFAPGATSNIQRAMMATGGGGGAGEAGADAVQAPSPSTDSSQIFGGKGGDGIETIIRTGTPEHYGGGAGSSIHSGAGTVGPGGLGGGANGVKGSLTGSSGSANTGGGASGGGGSGANRGGNGGSGIVIIRYEIPLSV